MTKRDNVNTVLLPTDLKVGKLYRNPWISQVLLYPTREAANVINHTYSGHYPLQLCHAANYEVHVVFEKPDEIAMVLAKQDWQGELRYIKLLVDKRMGWMLYADQPGAIKDWKLVE